MFRLQTVDPQQATGKVAEAYSVFPSQVPVPLPMRMLSASPDLALMQSNLVRYFMGHKALSFKLLTMIRYLVAADQGYPFCEGFNGNMLKMTGLDDVQLETIHADPSQAPLEPREKAMLLLVLKTLRTPETINELDIEAVRAQGFSDSDIMDAMYLGGSMLAPAILTKALTSNG